jgi:hypothetical protein
MNYTSIFERTSPSLGGIRDELHDYDIPFDILKRRLLTNLAANNK